MFSAEQKKYIYDNSIKINDRNKYIEIMAYYSDFFDKSRRDAIIRYIKFLICFFLLFYISADIFISYSATVRECLIKSLICFVGALVIYKIGKFIYDYIDDSPIIKKIQNKECDLLCYSGVLSDVSKFINYKASSSAWENYFMTVSGNKFQIDKKNYTVLKEHKGKKVYIYYFAELLQRQMLITDGTIILVEE